MAQQTISEVYVNVSGGRPQSTCYTGQITLEGSGASPRDVDTVSSSAIAKIPASRRTVLHVAAIQYQLDEPRALPHPLGCMAKA
jgi:cell division ATPase FtsA